ncbi:MAG: hypothetical protein ABI861_03235 [Panacibacter sp.]
MLYKKSFYLIVFITAFFPQVQAQSNSLLHNKKTAFQIAAPWRAEYDVRSDLAIVYGINDGGEEFEKRVNTWKSRGYSVGFMTGIAWGSYQDYFTGKFDGKTHLEDGQVKQNGETIWHGNNVPYVVPSPSYLMYIQSHVKRAIDAGITEIFLEEPEYWARAGYSESFKKEWQKFYHTPWVPQHKSPEATYLSSKLKYQLYFNALKQVFQYAKSYGVSKGLQVKCYVPTHSLLNYSAWQIISPEASLAKLPGMDGYIAQVWTGTSREPLYYNGLKKERVFANAFLEYGSMVSMIAPTGKKIFFLTDPIEDLPRTWDDYKRNYEATFTAQLLYPMVADYEVMPWPDRIYLGKFKLENNETPQPIAPAYATQMQVMVNALNNMPVSSNKINGSKGIAVLLANTMMFQRFPVHKSYTDPQLSNFYGMAMPLLQNGIPVETVHIENINEPAGLKNIKVLIMSYSNMKPLLPEYHKSISEWVKKGGALIYYGRDNDPFQTVKEWWNTGSYHFNAPSEHLFKQLNIKVTTAEEEYVVSKGKVFIIRQDPKELVMKEGQDRQFIQLVKKAYEQVAKAGNLVTKNNFLIERGPYTIAAVLEENPDEKPLQIKGPVIDLFDPELPVLSEKIIAPGHQGFLYNLNRINNRNKPQVLAAASRIYEEKITGSSYSFLTKSPSFTENVIRVLLPAQPTSIRLTDIDQQKLIMTKNNWDQATHTCLLQFENMSSGIGVKIDW